MSTGKSALVSSLILALVIALLVLTRRHVYYAYQTLIFCCGMYGVSRLWFDLITLLRLPSADKPKEHAPWEREWRRNR